VAREVEEEYEEYARKEGVCERSSAKTRSERIGERKDTLSGAILVIATRVLHSPLNNASARARTRHARARRCACESERLTVSKDSNGVGVAHSRKDSSRGRLNYSRDA